MKAQDLFEEFMPYDVSAARRLATQLLGGVDGDPEQAKKMAQAFLNNVLKAIDNESGFVNARMTRGERI